MIAAMEIGSVVLKAKSISGISAALAASTTSPEVGERIIAAGDLALTGGGATGVSINIKKADGTNIDINSADSGIALTSAATQQLNFTANYISTSAAVTAGQANAVAQVNISYM